MTPVRIRHRGRELFALYTSPTRPVPFRCAVLLCNPFGQEAIRAHRLYRVLGDRLSAAGFHVLRFDYYGTGDSAGEDQEFDLDGSVADAIAAGRWLMERSGASELSCAGLRLGGTVSLLASQRWPQPLARLLLMDPVLDGKAYLSELVAANERALARTYGARWVVDARLRRFNVAEPGAEALGFALTPALREQISRIKPTLLAARHCSRTLILSRQADDLQTRLEDHARGQIEILPAETDIDWATDSAVNTAIVPAHWIERLLQHLNGLTVHA
ncbi:MAG: alpha/beta hydrolase [Gammaproteobacteria bacterium]|nr:alpha/beta hydrolase [Gammaproteobacteria bacterium]